MNPTDLPTDIFLLVLAQLIPKDLIVLRFISRAFHSTLTSPHLNYHLLTSHFPRCRELRLLSPSNPAINWANIFSRVASRYHYLQTGSPRELVKIPLAKSLVVPSWCRHHPVAPWQRYLQFEEKKSLLHYPDSLWTYENGALVFPSAKLGSYVVYDVEFGVTSPVSFEPEDMIVRRLRLNDGVLIVEWCESEAYHQLNESEMVNRHFASAYEVRRDTTMGEGRWKLVLRSEWKIHFLGLPLNSKDRFFSAHDNTHYALYLWQPNRSAWGEDEPIEALSIWDISTPSSYRPSLDPSGELKTSDLQGPKVIRRFSFTDLDFYQVRQRSTPILRGIELDENHVYVIEEDHRWIVGQQAGHSLPRLHKVRTVGIPFFEGPRLVDECGADGDVNLSFCERITEERRPGLAPCWRHEEFPYLTIAEAVDANAGVVFSARHCFMLETISINVKPRVHMTGPGYEISLRDDLWQYLLAKGKICGDERWLVGENTDGEVVILYFDQRGRCGE